jgi:hypothetical protein
MGGASRLIESSLWVVTGGIHAVFRGLKFEPNAEMGQKGVFFRGLILITSQKRGKRVNLA